MKKFISLLLVMTMVLSLIACGGNQTEETTDNAEILTNEGQDMSGTEENDAVTEEQTGDEADNTEDVTDGEAEEPAVNETEQENTEPEENTGSSEPQTKPEEEKKPEQNSSNTAEQKPVANSKPEKEETKKEETKKEDSKKEDNKKEENKKEENKKDETSKEETSSATVGQTLLSVFKKNAASKSTQELADMLITNEVILFMGGSMPVEPGLLSGFDNAEITGFKEGVMFAPMMGSIAFVGYVFEVEDGTDVNDFMKTLKSNANPRWQICVEAEETIIEAVGNKVFFLMCPRSLEQ